MVHIKWHMESRTRLVLLLLYEEQKAFSVGIAVGNLTLAAAMLGYKCGICSAFSQDNVGDILLGKKTPAGEPNPMEPKLLVGVGFNQ